MNLIFQSTILKRWGKFFRYLIVDLADKRTIKWPLMENPLWVCLIVYFYIFFVTYWGPKLMQNRQPFKMQKVLIVYNFLHVVFSGYLAYDALFTAFLSGAYSLKCEPVNWARSIEGMIPARGCYFYFLAKISELLDTVFFILRKKNNQVSFLHVFHHTGMVFLAYGVTKYYPGGNVIFYGMLNSMVHTVMYLYYMISAMGPKFQKYLWWKKYITKIQMTQFFIGVLHATQLLFVDCGFPRWSLVVLVPNGIAFYFLFDDFYKQAYEKAQADKMLRDRKKDKEGSETSYETELSEKPDFGKDAKVFHYLLAMYTVLLGVFVFSYNQDLSDEVTNTMKSVSVK